MSNSNNSVTFPDIDGEDELTHNRSIENNFLCVGCWTDSETAVAICCAQLGGTRVNLTDSPVAGCAYNNSTGFIADGQNSTNSSGTFSRWSECSDKFWNASDALASDLGVVTVCQEVKKLEVTQSGSGTPSSTSTSTAPASSKSPNSGRAMYGMEGRFGRIFIFGVVAGSGLLHLLSLAM
jgi:hypothetical protein